MNRTIVGLAGWMVLGLGHAAIGDDAERKALAYLGTEVPRWTAEHRCLSCHNNGDGARALYRAIRAGHRVDAGALGDTTRWLAKPDGWDANGPGGPSSDKRLARVEFAAALAEAVRAGVDGARPALKVAAVRLAADQGDDGSWPVEDGGTIGAPATYGRRLATAMAVVVLREADPRAYADAILRAGSWLGARLAENVVEAASVLLIEPNAPDAPTTAAGRAAMAFLLGAQAKDGAWGPYRDSPTEPFDTGLALSALARFRDRPGVAEALDRGRKALVASQSEDGSWPETTRPAGGESYAQRISTAAWAAIGLIEAGRPD